MPRRKLILVTIAAAALLVGGAAVVVKVLVDPVKVKAMLEQKARTATGRELHIGALDFNLLPIPSLHATQVALGNAAWSKTPHALEVDRVDAELSLLPLLVGKVHVTSLSLDGVKATLETAQDGASNWKLAPEAAPAKQDDKAEGGKHRVEIGEVRIHDAVVRRLVDGAEAEPWVVPDAYAKASSGMRDVHANFTVLRHDQPLHVRSRFDDLSQLGAEGATSNGHIDLAWDKSTMSLDGRIPLHRTLAGHEVAIAMTSPSLLDVYRFFGFKRGASAPFALNATARWNGKAAAIEPFVLTLGDTKVTGELLLTGGETPMLTGRLETPRLDWKHMLEQSGGVLKPPRHDQEIFHEDPVAWRTIKGLGTVHARIDLRLASFKMGNGVEMTGVQARATLGDARIALEPLSMAMLGGHASGSLRFDGAQRIVRVDLSGEQLSLERWFHERGSKIPFKGGPMQVTAKLALSGDTFRALAASVSGPVTIRVGKGTWESARAGEVETLMVAAFNGGNDKRDIRFDCISTRLDFKNGLAQGKHVMGAKSDASQLLTDGSVDFRDEMLDLRGRVQAKKGVTLGLAAVAGGIQIGGHIAKPQVRLDPVEKPLIVARAAAAVATAGASIVGESLLHAATKDDACEAVFR